MALTPLESRYDVYVSCSEDIGVKVRGDRMSPEIEIKLRKGRTDMGIELWEKVNIDRLTRILIVF